MTRASGFGGSRVSNEDELRIEIERPQREARLKVRHTDRADTRLAPLARTSGVTRVAGLPVTGSSVIVTPRASLLWKPRPAFA